MTLQQPVPFETVILTEQPLLRPVSTCPFLSGSDQLLLPSSAGPTPSHTSHGVICTPSQTVAFALCALACTWLKFKLAFMSPANQMFCMIICGRGSLRNQTCVLSSCLHWHVGIQCVHTCYRLRAVDRAQPRLHKTFQLNGSWSRARLIKPSNSFLLPIFL